MLLSFDQTLFWATASVGINGNLNDLHHSVQSDAEFALWPQALRRRLSDGPILHPLGPPYDRVSDYRAGPHNEAAKAVAEAARTSLRSNMTVLIWPDRNSCIIATAGKWPNS